MTWGTVQLHDGRHIPGIGFGSSHHPGADIVEIIDTAIEAGFDHIDTAQAYRNEADVGIALKQSGLSRKDVWVTTKWSFPDSNPTDALHASLRDLGLDYVDLYLIHGTWATNGDIKGKWREMEGLYKAGLTKSIGISNFSVENMEEVLSIATVKPVVNQIQLHPNVLKTQTPIIEFARKHNIVIEAYSPNVPLRDEKPTPVVQVVEDIAARLEVKSEQILLAWSRAKGFVPVTTSATKSRMESYIAAGNVHLTSEDVKAIDEAGYKATEAAERKANMLKRSKAVAAGGLLVLAVYKLIAHLW